MVQAANGPRAGSACSARNTRKNASMSASVAVSPSPLKSAESQVAQQLPAMQRKKSSMSASVAVSPSLLKSAELTVRFAASLVTLPQALVTTQSYEPASVAAVLG